MQTKAKVSHFVAGGSTGGTISGTGRFLKDMNPDIHVMLPDPVGSVFWDFWAKQMAEKELKAKSYQVCIACLDVMHVPDIAAAFLCFSVTCAVLPCAQQLIAENAM